MVELKQLVEESIFIYNEMQPHLSLDMKTPNQVHKKDLALSHQVFHLNRQPISGRDISYYFSKLKSIVISKSSSTTAIPLTTLGA